MSASSIKKSLRIEQISIVLNFNLSNMNKNEAQFYDKQKIYSIL